MAGSIFRKYERRNVVHYGRARRAELKKLQEKEKVKKVYKPVENRRDDIRKKAIVWQDTKRKMNVTVKEQPKDL